MRYHVELKLYKMPSPLWVYAVNATEDELRERFIEPYELGSAITWQGRTIQASQILQMRILESPGEVRTKRRDAESVAFIAVRYAARDITNSLIHGPPGYKAAPSRSGTAGLVEAAEPDSKRVMVVYGRNLAIRDAMFAFLRALGLYPIEWEDAVAQTGIGSPHNLAAVRAAMRSARAVIVLFTAEDEARLLPALARSEEPAEERELRGQPRPNVLLEAGLALAIDPAHTILVEVGAIRRASDLDGLNTVRLSNAAPSRQALRNRLITAGCDVAETSDWLEARTGGDFSSRP